MKKVYYEIINNDICNILIAFNQAGLIRCVFNVDDTETKFYKLLNSNFDSVIKENGNSVFAKEIKSYFSNKLKKFNIPVVFSGTDFQNKVWKELMNVPFGEVRTYKQIAHAVGCDKGYRAIGNVNNKNPVAIVVPCHRIIGYNGSLTGYAPGIKYKVELLKHEGHMPYLINKRWFIVNN